MAQFLLPQQHKKMFERSAAPAWAVGQFPLSDMEVELHSVSSSGWKSKNCNRRRFNDDQIRSLETMFETEARPELHTKQQLANKLRLQPRQVAIWFQNKRARSKSKQIEQDHAMLKLSYDNLASKFESLKKENESLIIQLQSLRKLAAAKNRNEDFDKLEDINRGTDKIPDFLETYSPEINMSLCKDTSGEKVDYQQEQETTAVYIPS